MKSFFATRKFRARPHLDDKILTSWNALMITSLIKGYSVLGKERYLEAAQTAMQFIYDALYVDKQLLRRYRDGEARFNAFLDDYAYLIQALIELYQVDKDSKWLLWAKELQETVDAEFWSEEERCYYYTSSNAENLIVRSKEFGDTATPSAAGVTLSNLLRLSVLFEEPRYEQRAKEIFTQLSEILARYPNAFASILLAYDFSIAPQQQLVIAGEVDDRGVNFILNSAQRKFRPYLLVAFQDDNIPFLRDKTALDGQPTYYWCENRACQEPTTEVGVIDERLSS